MRVVTVLLVVGCGYRAGQVSGGGSGSADAPTLRDAARDGAPLDSDGDGIPDSVDNCPLVANPDQHDEDGDVVGDVCDPCPQVAHEPAVDVDGDGIPDACDPRPTIAGDRLLLFEPFKTAGGLPAGWSVKAGPQDAWQVSGDALHTAPGNTTYVVVYNAGVATHAIDTSFAVTASTTSNFSFVTLLTDARADIHQYVGCGLRLDTNWREFITYDQTTQFNQLAPNDMSEPIITPGAYHTVSVMNTTNETCSNPHTNQHFAAAGIASRGNTYVGIRIADSTVAVDYVAIYTF